MKSILRFRWLILAAWVIAAVILMINSPNMAELIREKGQLTVADGYPSKIASEIIEKHSSKEKGTEAFIVVFHDDKELEKSQLSHIETTMGKLEKDKSRLGISEVTTHFNDDALKDQLVSKDGNTIIALLDVKIGKEEISEVRDRLDEAIATDHVDTYMTGNALINEDVIISSENGLKKTEVITVIFIMVVLVLVFRSVVAPLVPLLTVGLTYVVSQAVVAFLVDGLNFPISNFTATFLVAILFGIGTDYCILLLSRYKEELSTGQDIQSAIITTYKTAGKTVIFSALAVMIGFASIGFATFKLYQSAVGVAVGVFVLVIALFTIVPFFMATLKTKLFWPVKKNISHSESRLWGWMGNLAITRPLIALGIVAVFTVPLLVSYDGELSFNSLDEIGEEYDSVKGFNLVADSFGPGEIMPIQVILENDDSMKTKEYLALIESIGNDLEKIDHVSKIRSVTRPTGDKLEEIYVKKQVNELGKGMEEGTDGISQIKDGLNEAATSIKDSKPDLEKATAGIGELQAGTKQLQSGVGELQTALNAIESGIRQGTDGAGELKDGAAEASKQAAELQSGVEQLLTGYEQAQVGIAQLIAEYEKVPATLQEAQAQLMSLEEPLTKLAQSHPEIMEDPNFAEIQAIIGNATKQVAIAGGTVSALNEELAKVRAGLETANNNLSQISKGLGQFSKGLTDITKGLGQLESGLGEAAAGQHQVVQQIPTISSGIGEIATGQEQLQSGFGNMGSQLEELSDGLTQSSEGLGQIEDGFGEAENYLTDLANGTELQQSGIYIPDQLLTDKDFQQVFDIYMSADGKMTTMEVILDSNPYSKESMDMISKLEQTIENTTKNTKLEQANVGVGGVTSMNRDLESMSDSDYTKTVTFMMIGIVLILIILLRSLVMPIYIVGSLLLTYYSSIAMTEIIFVNILGYSGINWATPFFGFVILIALGVDYSIFLMDRFSEYKELDVKTGIMLAMKNMGTVIMSAAVILAGTFAAMLPSGVLSMLQIATLVLSGLLFYALIILPLFVPVLINLLGKGNWWPFMPKKD
ncbi:MMPL family transporter [Lederbergia lenta]|uniref:MMPL domain-containing protein n=1 Tax=Lederbergia lenta TaxID=1467 RepID=A0A2X4VSF1_LEDLE|nr:MMPL family transporter [Lederbergia lenta]MEC2326558.1 MMPL family transporter [Lederbergia lenta]SQI53179.1 MMPL domain-containing protein [Lederbergia lenta]